MVRMDVAVATKRLGAVARAATIRSTKIRLTSIWRNRGLTRGLPRPNLHLLKR
jgi:hypothetical protein